MSFSAVWWDQPIRRKHSRNPGRAVMTDSIYPPGPSPAGTRTDAIAINTFNIALAAAELTKQTSYESAQATFQAAGFSAAAFPAYKTAILNADKAYMTAVDVAGAAVSAVQPTQPFDDGSSFQALLPQNTALSIGLLYLWVTWFGRQGTRPLIQRWRLRRA